MSYIPAFGERIISQMELMEIDREMADLKLKYVSPIEVYDRWLEKAGAVAITVKDGHRTLVVSPEIFPIAQSKYKQWAFWKIGNQLVDKSKFQAWEADANEMAARMNSK